MKLFKLLCVLTLLALVLTIDSASHAQNPTPSSRIEIQPGQKKLTDPKQQPTNDERGTENIPLVIKGIPSQKTQLEAKEGREQYDIKMALDRELTSYTGWQALFSGILIGVGILQLGLFFWQLKMIRESLTDTKIAAEAAKVSANAALEEATAITLSERAYVFAKIIVVNERNLNPPNGEQFVQDGAAEFWNHGKTPAIILNMVIEKHISDEPPFHMPPLGWQFNEGLVIAAGNGYRLPIKIQLTDEETRAVSTRAKKLYCFGLVQYKDILNNERKTGYCWEYAPHPHRIFRFCDASSLNHYT